MPLTMMRAGESNQIKRITGKDETRKFLEKLGFVEGENITVISEMSGNLIVSVKNTRVALNNDLAKRIMV